MKRLTTIIFAGAVVSAFAVGCAPSRPPEIALSSSDFDLNPLVGEWRGNYTNPEAGRTGTIAFTLHAGVSSASGNVVMIPHGADSSLYSHAAIDRSVLKINFIRKQGQKVSGTLDPFRDPTCGCQVTTTFEGDFTDAHTIEGTFSTAPLVAGPKVTSGTWKVTRVKRL
jgi:hypothetical protein